MLNDKTHHLMKTKVEWQNTSSDENWRENECWMTKHIIWWKLKRKEMLNDKTHHLMKTKEKTNVEWQNTS